MLEVSPLASVNHTPLNEYSLHRKNISLDLQELKLESTKSAWWRRGADGRGPCRWAWPLVPFLLELSKLKASRLPPRDNLQNNNLQNIFSYSGWGSDGGEMSLPWSGENDINLQPNMFSCSKPWVHFIKPMPASVFLYGAIHLWRTIKWPIVCLGFSVHWVSSCTPLNLISTWLLSIWTTTGQRAAGGGGTAGQMWTCEKGQGPSLLSLQRSH